MTNPQIDLDALERLAKSDGAIQKKCVMLSPAIVLELIRLARAGAVPDIHSCPPHCDRPLCVAQRRIAALEAQVKALQGEIDEDEHVRNRMGELLARTAIALKGPEKALHRHGWQDLPEATEAIVAELDALRKDASVHQLIQRACGELPDGWQIRLEMENGAGYFYLNNPEGDDVQFDDDREHLSSSLLSAIETAIAAQGGAEK